MFVIMMVFSLLDRKLREFGMLHMERRVEGIERSLVAGVKGSDTMLEKYPEDFDLYCLGELDTETGVLVPADPPRLVANVRDLLNKAGE